MTKVRSNKRILNLSPISLIIIGFNLIFVYLVIVPDYFPYLGFTLASSAYVFLLLLFRKNNRSIHYLLSILSIILSSFIFIRANPLLIFFNVSIVFYLDSILSWSNYDLDRITVKKLLIAPIYTFVKSIQAQNLYPIDVKMPKEGQRIKGKLNQGSFNKYFISFWITCFILLIIIPILSSANPLFKEYVTNFFSFIKLGWLWDIIFPEKWLPVLVTRTIIFFILTGIIPYVLSYANDNSTQSKKKNSNIKISEYLQLPKISIIIILLIFFFAQLQLYFPSNPKLKDFSENVNEIFGQLSIVCLIIFGLTYKDNNKERSRKITSLLLIVESFFLIGMAFKSDLDYTMTSGYTLKRLYGYAVIVWLSGIFLAQLYRLFVKIQKSTFIKIVIVYSVFIFISINILNFDHIIYYQDKFEDPQNLEHKMLSELSSDASSYHEQMPKLLETMKKECPSGLSTDTDIAYSKLMNHILMIEVKYEDYPWQSFNLSEYRQMKELEKEGIKYENIWRECNNYREF